jgi:hypothetical protein
MKTCALALLVSMIALAAQAEQQTRPVLGDAECHSIHAYFNTSPESPDGRFVLLFRSTTPDAHEGEVCLVDRKSGEVRVLASGVTTEDGHRVACQQWSCGGREVIFHDLRLERWVVVAVNVASGSERILAEGRMVGWGQPGGETIPLYGPHWNPGPHRDLELLNVRTGEITKSVTADEVRSGHSEWMSRQFAERPISIFFPILSPDERRVLFKVATPDGGGFRSPKGSLRMGLVIYDLAERRFLLMHESWGHPAWHPDSRQILNVASQRLIKIDSVTGRVERHPDLPPVPGSHPAFSPDGRTLVSDVRYGARPPLKDAWGVIVGNWETGKSEVVHVFENSQGENSWRGSHPHPVFSPDGKRVYYNVSDGKWTRLFVAEEK